MSVFNSIGSISVSQLERKFCKGVAHNGMILLEIITALGLIAIIGLIIAQYQALSSFWYYDSAHRMIALNKAATHLEYIMAKGFHEDYFPKQEDLFNIFVSSEPYAVSLPSGLSNSHAFKLISVRVEWQTPARQTRYVILRTIID